MPNTSSAADPFRLVSSIGASMSKSPPVPAAAWLFGSALGLLGVARRRAKS